MRPIALLTPSALQRIGRRSAALFELGLAMLSFVVLQTLRVIFGQVDQQFRAPESIAFRRAVGLL